MKHPGDLQRPIQDQLGRWVIFLSFLFLGITGAIAQNLPTKTIAIVREKPSPYFDAIVKGFETELRDLAQDQYNLKTILFEPEELTSQAIRATLEKALYHPEVDAVYTSGIASSHYAARFSLDGVRELPKPVIAGAVEFSDLSNELISNSGSSTVPNYSFVLVPNRIRNDLTNLASLAKTKVIDVPIESRFIEILGPTLTEDVAKFEKNLGINLRIHPFNGMSKTGLNFLPDDSKAVYLPILPDLTLAQRSELFSRLAKRGILHFSMIGYADVERGAFGGLASESSQTVHRRLALNLHQAILGVDTTLLPVVLRLADQLTINLETARTIGWSPDYDTTLSATLLNQKNPNKTTGALTLEGAMAKAAATNPDILAARAAWQQSKADTRVVKSAFNTTLGINGQIGASGTQDPINSFTTPANAQSASLGFEINRLLFSDRLYSQINAQTELQAATAFDRDSIILDTIELAAHAYLDSLTAEAIYRIQRDNLQLVQENLQLAKLRRDIGAQSNTDVLRWQASEASARSSLIQADTDRKNARTGLNVQLAVPMLSHWELEDIQLTNQQTYFLNEDLIPLVGNSDRFNTFTKFARELASFHAPELMSFDRTLRAQGIVLAERGRRNLRPEVQLSATAQRIFTDTTFATGDAQNEWTVGIGFTMPFLERDLQRAEMDQIAFGIRQLQAQRQKAVYLVEQRALAAAYNMGASHPAMRLARQARESAEKNYESVKEQYTLGQVDVVTLLDSQSNLLDSRQAEATTVYLYIKDAISLQRSIAWFEFTKKPEDIAAFTKRFRDYLKTGSIHVTVNNK